MINKAFLMGRIGNKETKITKTGKNITMLAIATSRKWYNQAGEKQEATTWHNVHCFNRLADVAEKYAHVGDLIFIEGEIQNKKVVHENVEKWMYSITASELKFLPKNKKVEKNEDDNSFNKRLDDDFVI